MLVNYTEVIVSDVYNDIANSSPYYCRCERCKEDVLCLTLNKLPVKYTIDSGKKAYARLLENEQQFKIEVMQVLVSATQTVVKNPRCKTINEQSI